MKGPPKTKAAVVLGAIVGAFCGMFLAGPAMFADGPLNERLVVVLILGLVSGVAAFLLGLLAPQYWFVLPLPLTAPVLAVSLYFGIGEPKMLGVAVLLVVASAGFSLLGAKIAVLVRRPRAPAEDAA